MISMAQKEYSVGGRSFRTEGDYKRALRDQETIEGLRKRVEGADRRKLEQLVLEVHNGKYTFYTMLGQDFEDELLEQIRQMQKLESSGGNIRGRAGQQGKSVRNKKQESDRGKSVGKPVRTATQVSEKEVLEELKRQEKRRKWVIVACALIAAVSLGYFGVYVYYNQRTSADYDQLLSLKEKKPMQSNQGQKPENVVIHYTEETQEIPEVLDEYKNLLIKNKKLIGWIKIDDTNIDYPVMQTDNNEYYLDHNMNQKHDKNGSIFMDKDCDVIKPSMNLILYGHHMQSGKMFGSLGKYSDEKFYEKHKYIYFDTIYEKGIYEVMYVFRSRVYNEGDVVFKYYQFIDAMSEVEFDSYMKEMADSSLYDTGVTASFGDRLLTLSTCDYQEKDGRFVVVAKRISKKE